MCGGVGGGGGGDDGGNGEPVGGGVVGSGRGEEGIAEEDIGEEWLGAGSKDALVEEVRSAPDFAMRGITITDSMTMAGVLLLRSQCSHPCHPSPR